MINSRASTILIVFSSCTHVFAHFADRKSVVIRSAADQLRSLSISQEQVNNSHPRMTVGSFNMSALDRIDPLCTDIDETGLALCFDFPEDESLNQCKIWIRDLSTKSDSYCQECSICNRGCKNMGLAFDCTNIAKSFLSVCDDCEATLLPTTEPSLGISFAPTMSPSRSFPAVDPSKAPTQKPNSTPSESSTPNPTTSPTRTPSISSTPFLAALHDGSDNFIFVDLDPGLNGTDSWDQQGIVIRLHGISELKEEEVAVFRKVYEHFVAVFNQNLGIPAEISIHITKIELSRKHRRHLRSSHDRSHADTRSLKNNHVSLTFSQETKLQAELHSDELRRDFVKEPFKKEEDRAEFVESLKSHHGLAGLLSVSHLELPQPPANSQSSQTAALDTRNIGTEKGFVALGATLGVVCIVLVLVGRRLALKEMNSAKTKRKESSFRTTMPSESLSYNSEVDRQEIFTSKYVDENTQRRGDDNSSAAPTHWQLSVLDGGDGISTIAGEQTVIRTFQDESSVVSGFTFEECEHHDNASHDGLGFPDIATGEIGTHNYLPRAIFGEECKTSYYFGDDSKFAMSLDGSTIILEKRDAQRGKKKEESSPLSETLVTVYAPPGRLGIVFDTSRAGTPTIAAVKDNSALSDRLEVGDRLIAVDGINVVSMSAIQVTRIITDKNTQPVRKLAVLRATKA